MKNTRGAAKPPSAPVETTQQASEVAVVEQAPLAAQPDMQSMFAADSAEFGGIDFKGDLAIPFIGVLQKGSPQVDDAHAKYIEGAKVGMALNTVTGSVIDMRRGKDGKGGVEVILCYYDKKFVEWVPREDGGGFVAQFEPGAPEIDKCFLNDKKRLVTPDGNLMVETAYHYILIRENPKEPWQWAVFPSKSSSLKMTRKWNSMVASLVVKGKDGKSIKPPVFSQVWLLSTYPDQKDDFTWAACDIAHIGSVSDIETYEMAKAFATAVKSGAVRVTAPPSDPTEGSGGPKSDKDVPF